MPTSRSRAHRAAHLAAGASLWMVTIACAPTAAPPGPASDAAQHRWPAPTRLYRIAEVIDGDTIKIEFDGRVESVRLLSVDTEEKIRPGRGGSPSKPQTVFGEETSLFVRRFFAQPGRERVGLRFPGPGPTRDVYGRLLAHVVLSDGTDFNVLLVRGGWSPYFVKYGTSLIADEAFRRAEEAARSARAGIWDPATNRPALPGAPAARRPYERLLPWWRMRAEAIAVFRRWRALDASLLSGDEAEGLTAALAHGRTVTVFGEVDRTFEEPDGSLTVRLRSGRQGPALRLSIPLDRRAATVGLKLSERSLEYRQNFLWAKGRIVDGPRGPVMRCTDPSSLIGAEDYPDPQSAPSASSARNTR